MIVGCCAGGVFVVVVVVVLFGIHATESVTEKRPHMSCVGV